MQLHHRASDEHPVPRQPLYEITDRGLEPQGILVVGLRRGVRGGHHGGPIVATAHRAPTGRERARRREQGMVIDDPAAMAGGRIDLDGLPPVRVSPMTIPNRGGATSPARLPSESRKL